VFEFAVQDYAVIKTKKNVVAAAVMISSTMRGSRKGFMPP
jgi:hypothetical protein